MLKFLIEPNKIYLAYVDFESDEVDIVDEEA